MSTGEPYCPTPAIWCRSRAIHIHKNEMLNISWKYEKVFMQSSSKCNKHKTVIAWKGLSSRPSRKLSQMNANAFTKMCSIYCPGVFQTARSTKSICYFLHLQINGMNYYLKLQQSTENGYLKVSMVSCRLYRNHVKQFYLFPMKV